MTTQLSTLTLFNKIIIAVLEESLSSDCQDAIVDLDALLPDNFTFPSTVCATLRKIFEETGAAISSPVVRAHFSDPEDIKVNNHLLLTPKSCLILKLYSDLRTGLAVLDHLAMFLVD